MHVCERVSAGGARRNKTRKEDDEPEDSEGGKGKGSKTGVVVCRKDLRGLQNGDGDEAEDGCPLKGEP